MDMETTAPETPAKRPGAITGIFVLGLIGTAGLAYLTLSNELYGLPDWYAPYLAIAAIAGMTALVGMFLMRKWGVYLYLGLLLVNQAVLLSMNAWTPMGLVVPVVVVITGFKYLHLMR